MKITHISLNTEGNNYSKKQINKRKLQQINSLYNFKTLILIFLKF
jgi:hypothetical protein